ncbi:MAG: TOPRIM nucleotidyl transferase/hydrolase domain-containing protein [Ilumatobacteraceae bacterium]
MKVEQARDVPAGYVHGPAAATDGLRAALAKTTDPVAMILVEGVSDQIAVETVASRCGRDLTTERIAVVPIGGASAMRGVLSTYASATQCLVALCDADEVAQVRRGIDASGLAVAVFVCDPDLEAELIRAVGVDRVLAVLDRHGDHGSFVTLQKQVAWRGQAVDAQLHRFIGAGARRKLRYARLLSDAAADIDRVPQPLSEVLDATVDGGHPRPRQLGCRPQVEISTGLPTSVSGSSSTARK